MAQTRHAPAGTIGPKESNVIIDDEVTPAETLRAELFEILADHPEAVEGIVRLYKLHALLPADSAVRWEIGRRLDPDAKRELREIKSAAEALRQALAASDSEAATWTLPVDLTARGAQPWPSGERVAEALRSAPAGTTHQAMGDGRTLYQVVTLAAANESRERRERGARPFLFLEALEDDLDTLAESADALLTVGSKPGRPRDYREKLAADGVVTELQRCGLKPTHSYSGTLCRTLRAFLEALGIEKSDEAIQALARKSL